jgi:hypothetical protein
LPQAFWPSVFRWWPALRWQASWRGCSCSAAFFIWRLPGAATPPAAWFGKSCSAYDAIGFYILAHPLVGLESLTLAVAVYLFVEGVLEFILWFQLRTTPGKGWLLFDGIVTLVLAAMIGSTWPSSAAWVIGTLVGISIFFSGISRLVLSLTVRRRLA